MREKGALRVGTEARKKMALSSCQLLAAVTALLVTDAG